MGLFGKFKKNNINKNGIICVENIKNDKKMNYIIQKESELSLNLEKNNFPEILDGAEVLYYTKKDDYGCVYYENDEVADYIKFLAICTYSNVMINMK